MGVVLGGLIFGFIMIGFTLISGVPLLFGILLYTVFREQFHRKELAAQAARRESAAALRLPPETAGIEDADQRLKTRAAGRRGPI